jgi:hypothetical protein
MESNLDELVQKINQVFDLKLNPLIQHLDEQEKMIESLKKSLKTLQDNFNDKESRKGSGTSVKKTVVKKTGNNQLDVPKRVIIETLSISSNPLDEKNHFKDSTHNTKDSFSNQEQDTLEVKNNEKNPLDSPLVPSHNEEALKSS